VFSGGGIHGLNHIGFLSYIKYALGGNTAFREQIKGFAGTSIGAFLSMLLACGETNLWQLFHWMTNPLFFARLLQSVNLPNTWRSFGAIPPRIGIEYICSILDSYFWGGSHFTFADLYERTEKELCVAVVNASTGQAEYHSHKTTPHLLVAHSVYASMCVPFLCQPTPIHGSLYFDGGLLDNFPLFKCGFPSDECLGSYLETELSIGSIVLKPPSVGSWARFVLDVVYMMSRPLSNVYFPRHLNDNIVIIPQSKTIHFLKLWASSNELYRLFLRGLYYTRQHFRKFDFQQLLTKDRHPHAQIARTSVDATSTSVETVPNTPNHGNKPVDRQKDAQNDQ